MKRVLLQINSSMRNANNEVDQINVSKTMDPQTTMFQINILKLKN